MSEASPAGRPAPQEFENVLASATTTVASFDEEQLTFLQRVQRFLHAYPTTVPFVVLLLGVLLGVTSTRRGSPPPAIFRRSSPR